MKIENDPDLKMQKQILDHHPHTAHMPPHGTIRKANPMVHHKVLKAMKAERMHTKKEKELV